MASASAVVCPRCGMGIPARDIDLAGGLFLCAACQERYPLSAPASGAPSSRRSLDVATPQQPIQPGPVRTLQVATPVQPMSPTSSSRISVPQPGSEAGGPLGSSWKEHWDGHGFHVILRRVSVSTVAVFILLIIGAAVWTTTQKELFGEGALVAVGVGVVLGILGVLKMLAHTYLRFDALHLVIEHKPAKLVSSISTPEIEGFAYIDEHAPGRTRAGYIVGVIPSVGLTVPLDVELYNEAEARFVADRLNQMLLMLTGRGPVSRRKP